MWMKAKNDYALGNFMKSFWVLHRENAGFKTSSKCAHASETSLAFKELLQSLGVKSKLNICKCRKESKSAYEWLFLYIPPYIFSINISLYNQDFLSFKCQVTLHKTIKLYFHCFFSHASERIIAS